MECQIFSVLKNRLASGRKSFSKIGTSYLSKVCATYYENSKSISLENIQRDLNIDTSEEDEIREFEEKIKNNKINRRADKKEKIEKTGIQKMYSTNNFIKRISELTDITDLRLSY